MVMMKEGILLHLEESILMIQKFLMDGLRYCKAMYFFTLLNAIIQVQKDPVRIGYVSTPSSKEDLSSFEAIESISFPDLDGKSFEITAAFLFI
jgi:hypothetical protein